MAVEQTGSSTSAFVSSLIFNLVIFAIFVGIFVLLRNKCLNVYRPRTDNRLLPDHLKAPPLAPSAFGWFTDLLTRPKSFVLQQVGVDGYFFLRYLLLWAYVGFFGGLILWPILFAVNASGGGNKTGFDIISYSNNTHKWRVFANLFCSWAFFAFVVYVIYTELVYYTGFRHNMQCTPFYSSLPSSKVLLIDNVDQGLLFEDSLRRLFPAASRIAITRDTTEARETWEKRGKLTGKLEGAFTKVLSKCIKKRSKLEKKAEKGNDVEFPTPVNSIESYIPEKKLPTYKYKPIIGKSKKVFNEGLDELDEFNRKLDTEQGKIKESSDSLAKVGSVFLEFPSHLELQRAYQAVNKSDNFKKSRRFQSFMPEDVIWKNVGIGYVARKSKRAGAKAFLTLMIIYWAIPVAVVGCISNINNLTNMVPFLRFINNMPSVLMGIITGILPSVLLAILMSLVPPIIRYWGKQGGCMTLQHLDLWTQQWFYAFQVIQVFLVTTCTSAASSSVTKIISQPSMAMTLLSQNLPPASNFYISYMLLQGLSISSGMLAQVVGLILSFVLGRLLDKTPRQKWNRQVNLSPPSWGTLYGSFGLFTVIMLCYSIIAPIIIAFTCIAFMLIYTAMMYSLVYVSGHTTDNRGRNYPLALFEVFVGVYLAEIVLIILFVMQKNWACVVLEAVWLALTVVAHLYFRRIFEPVLDTVPIGAIEGMYPCKDLGREQVFQEGQRYFVKESDSSKKSTSSDSYVGTKSDSKSVSFDELPAASMSKTATSEYQSQGQGPGHAPGAGHEDAELDFKKMQLEDRDYSGMATNFEEYVSSGYKDGMRYVIQRFLHPRRYVNYSNYRPLMPQFWSLPLSSSLAATPRYQPPEITDDKAPVLWVARDQLGLSEELKVVCSEHGVSCSDADAVYDEKAKVQVTDDSYPPGYESTIMY